MPYLTIARLLGEPERLLDAYRRSSGVMSGVGRDHGLLVHAAAQTGEGLLIVNLWRAEEGAQAATRDPRRLGAMERHGLEPGDFRREHDAVADYVLFP